MQRSFLWKRFWCKPEGTIGLDDNGFLLDPELKDILYKETDVVSFKNIEKIQCLILLGQPGIGKSEAVYAEYNELLKREDGNYIIFKNLNEYGDENRFINNVFNSAEINGWLRSDKDLVIFLDSFDECLLEIRKLANIIKYQIEKLRNRSSRLFLRITCRTGYWPEVLSQFLSDFFGKENFGILELAPLRITDVELAAKSASLNSDRFLMEIINNELQTLAINPLTLNILINEYQFNNHIASTKETLFFNGCRLLCTEPNKGRQSIIYAVTTSPERKVALASRIAAVMIFCNRQIIDLHSQPLSDENTLSLDMLLEGEEITDDYTFNFTQQDLKDTIIQSSLFTSRGNSYYVFSHFAYCEFLAAKFITNHQLAIEQIQSLITISSDNEGKIIPQIKGTAAWLGILSSKLTEFTIKHDPQNLLYGDINNLNDDYKRNLVESLLNKFNENTIDDSDWGLNKHYKKLVHPNLSTQIKSFIEDPKTNFLVRRVAMNIAEACNLIDLNQVLLKIALDSSEDIHSRSNAAYALIKLGDNEIKKKLIPLAIEPQGDDLDDDLKGYSLRALWPTILSTKEVFRALTPPKKSNYSGGYVFFIYMLQDEIKNGDLDVCLEWILKYSNRDDYSRFIVENIEDIIIYNFWNNLDELSNLPLFAKVLLMRMRDYRSIFPTPQKFRKEWNPLVIKDGSRIKVLKEILNIIHIDEVNLIRHNELIHPEDFEIIFDFFIRELNPSVKLIIAKLLGYFLLTGVKEINLILSNIDKHVELKEEFQSLVEPIELNSPLAEKLKRDWYEIKKWQKEATEKKQKIESFKINVYERLLRDIDDFESTRNITYWYQFFMDLTLTETSTHYTNELNSDITSLPGWKIIDEKFKERIFKLSKFYIENFNDDKDQWFGSNTFFRPATAGYKSLIILYFEEPTYILNLKPETWKNWVHILLDYPETYGISGHKETYIELIREAYTKIPGEIIKVLMSIIDTRNEKDELHLFVLAKIKTCMDANMQKALLIKVMTSPLKPLAQHYIISLLLEYKNIDANKLAKEIITKNTGIIKIEIAKALANYCTSVDWDYLMNEVRLDKNFGKELFMSILDLHVYNMIPLLERITEKQSANLFLWLSDNFPKEEDPIFEGAHMVGPRERVGNFRDRILNFLTTKGTKESLEALNFIQEKKPDQNINFYLVAAKKNFRTSNWDPLQPKELLLLANNSKTRVILSSDDLLNLIIDSLKRLEVVLQGDNSLSSTLWDRITSIKGKGKGKYIPKPEENLSDFIIHHLNHELKIFGISSYREVQLRKPNHIEGGKEGEKTDIFVTYTHPKNRESFEIIIEVKGSWNKNVILNIQNQLLERYLKKGNHQYGLYLVGWYNCEAYYKRIDKTGSSSLDDAKKYFLKRANELSTSDKTIKSFVLDCSLKN
jgi:hypothetical protein